MAWAVSGGEEGVGKLLPLCLLVWLLVDLPAVAWGVERPCDGLPAGSLSRMECERNHQTRRRQDHPRGGGGAEEAAPDPQRVMTEIFALSGLESQLASVADAVGQGVAERGKGQPPELLQSITEVMAREFSADRLRKGVLGQLRVLQDARHAGPVLEWLRSPLGRRFTRAEEAASTPEGHRALEAYDKTLRANPPTADRVALMRQLDESAGMTEVALDSVLAVSLGVTMAFNSILPKDQQPDPARAREMVLAGKEQLRPLMAQVSLTSGLYAYRDFSDAEIAHYIAMMSSEAGQWYRDVTRRAFLQTIFSIAVRTGEAVLVELKRLGRQGSL